MALPVLLGFICVLVKGKCFCEEWRNRVCSWMGSPSPLFPLSHLPMHLWCTWSLKLSRCDMHTEYSCWLPTLLLTPGSCVGELPVASSMRSRSSSWSCRPMRGSVLPPFWNLVATGRRDESSGAQKGADSPASPTTSAPNILHPASVTW